MNLQDADVRVKGGEGLVARFPATVLVVTGGSDNDATVDALIEACRKGGDGRTLAKRLAGVVVQAEDATVLRWAGVEISTEPPKAPPARRSRGKAADAADEAVPPTTPIEAPMAEPMAEPAASGAPIVEVPVAAPGPVAEGAPLAPAVAPVV